MISEAAVYIQKKNVKIVSLNSTVAVDVWQTLIISMERSMNDAYDVGCEMQRKRVECAIMIKAALADA